VPCRYTILHCLHKVAHHCLFSVWKSQCTLQFFEWPPPFAPHNETSL
jgi:hypothetical protein